MSMAERMSAVNMRASNQRRASTGDGKTDGDQNNGKTFPDPTMNALCAGFSLDAEKIASDDKTSAELKENLTNLTGRLELTTAAMLADSFNMIATTETFGEVEVVIENDTIHDFLDEAQELETAAEAARAAADQQMVLAAAAVQAASSEDEKERAAEMITEAEALENEAMEAESKAATEGDSLKITTTLSEEFMQVARDAMVAAMRDVVLQHIEDSIVIAMDDVLGKEVQLTMLDSLDRSIKLDAPIVVKQHPKRIEAQRVHDMVVDSLKDLETTLASTRSQLTLLTEKLNTATKAMNEGGPATEKQLGAVKNASAGTKAVKEIITEQKNGIHDLMSEYYPGIGSRDANMRNKPLAQCELEMPDGLTDSTGDPTIGKKMLALFQQVCQTYSGEFYPIMPILELMIANPDPSDPIKIPKICEVNEWYGVALGTAYKKADGLLYDMIERTNELMITMSATDLETGGNGDPNRKSVAEEGSAVSVISYWLHNAMSDIEDLKRKQTQIMNQSFSLFQSGPIVKAAETFMQRYRVADSYGIKLNFRDTIHPSAMLISKRGNGQPVLYNLGMAYVNDAAMKARCDDAGTCTPEIGAFLGQVMKIAKKMGNDNPSQVDDAMAKATLVQMNAFTAIHSKERPNHHQKSKGGGNEGGNSESEWKCSNISCKNGKVPLLVKKKYISKQCAKYHKTAHKVKEPPHLLCTVCQKEFDTGTEITLKNGKQRERWENKNPKAESESGGEKPTAGKNNNRNRVRRAKKAVKEAELKVAIARAEAELKALKEAQNGDSEVTQDDVNRWEKVQKRLDEDEGAPAPDPAPASAPASSPSPAAAPAPAPAPSKKVSPIDQLKARLAGVPRTTG